MPVATVSVNPFNPACLETSCLNQIVGLSGNDAVVQFSSCVAQFGSPVVSTVIPTETVFATATTTVEYIDVIVSLTTATSTLEETLTSYDSVFATATEYTTTNVVTISTRVTGNPAPSSLKKMRKRKNCTRKPSSALSQTETVTATEVPEPSTAETETITSTPSAAPVCSDEAEYSSACSCIGAIGDITETVTATAEISTSTIYETVSSAIPSISESVVNVVVTTVVVKPATITATNTVSTGLQITTTVTSVLQPTQTAQLLIEGGPRTGKPLNVVSSYVQWANTGTGSNIVFSLASGQPWLPGQPAVKLYVHSANSQVGVLYFQTAAQAATSGDVAVTCSANENDTISCANALGHSKFLQCGAYVYLASPAFSQASCTEVAIKPASLAYVS